MYIHNLNIQILNWELKENFALKIVNMGSFIVYAVVREDWLVKTSLQHSDS